MRSMSVAALAVIVTAILLSVEGNETIALLFSALLLAMRIGAELYFELPVYIKVCFAM